MYDQAISAIKASELRMSVSAHNVARNSSNNERAHRVTQQARPRQSGVQADVVITDNHPDIITESTEQIYTPTSLRAAVASAHTQEQMQQQVINLFEGVPEPTS